MVLHIGRDGAVQNAVDEALDGGHGGAQLVGDVAHELAAGIVVGLDVLRHLVEGVGQIHHFALTFHALNTDREVPAAKPLGGIGDLLERVGQLPHQEGGQHAGAEQHDTGREEEVRAELLLEVGQPGTGGTEEEIATVVAPCILHVPHRDIALLGQHTVQRAQGVVGLIPGNFFHKLRPHNICSHHLGVGGNEDPALFIGEKEVSLGAFADDLQLGVQGIQLGPLGQSRLLHDIIRRALGHIRHTVQRVVPLLGKIAAEQQPLGAAQHRRAQHQQGGHHRKEGDRNTFAHY